MIDQKPMFPQNGVLYVQRNHCGVCKALLPKVEQLMNNEFRELEFRVINAEDFQVELAQRLVLAVPAILIFADGKEYFRSTGLVSIEQIKQAISTMKN